MTGPRINPVFRARIEGGEIRWHGDDGKRWAALKNFYEGKDVEIVLRRPQKKTTDPQRRYYFGVLVAMICEAVGEDNKEAVHEELKQMFLKDHTKPFPVARSTESLTTVEREEYHEKIRRWASSFLGLYLPLPNEIDLENIAA